MDDLWISQSSQSLRHLPAPILGFNMSPRSQRENLVTKLVTSANTDPLLALNLSEDEHRFSVHRHLDQREWQSPKLGLFLNLRQY